MNKKKICIGLIIALVILNAICFGKVFLNYKNKKLSEVSADETIEDTPSKDKEDEIIVESEQIAEKEEEYQEESNQQLDQTQSANVESTTVTSSNQQGETIKITSNKPQTEQSQVSTRTQSNENTKETQATQQQLQNNETQQKQNVETFKVNNAMIEKIRSIINNNPSDTMKQYGYNIVVDSSIVNQSNQFTFTETRVKNAIKFSFGTIRIYARDYFVNNEYRWTESFIL